MGTFKFRCVFCRQKIEAQDEWDGMFAECPGCGRQIEVRRDDEFAVKPPHTPLAPEVPPQQEEETGRPHPTFQKPFPPKMPAAATRPVRKPPVRPAASPPVPAAEAAPPAPEPMAHETDPVPPSASEPPKPFPKPFTIELPKWELPETDKKH